ncbi:MAG: hypothetical protein WBP16_16930 [Ferruginibacter sp.]
MKGDMGPGSGDLEKGLEKLKSMDPDSVKALMQKGIEAMDSLKKAMEKH